MNARQDLPDTSLWVASRRFEDGPRRAVVNPWTGETITYVVEADENQASMAARAAAQAFDETRRLSSFARKQILRRVAEAIATDRDRFARLIALEAGKPIVSAQTEVARAISTFELAAEEATRLGGEIMPLDITESAQGYRGSWTRVPVGPVLGISPFNFPLNLVAHKVAPAIACGCPIVLKPAPQTPLCALALSDIVREAGAPPNMLQVVPCEVPVAESLVRHPSFATLSFTGSAEVGWKLRALADRKRSILELGGNAAVIVHDDGASTFAFDRILTAAFAYAGQVCIKVQRLYLHKSLADAWIASLVQRTKSISASDPLDPTTLMGSMIDESAAKRVESWVEEACDQGARLLVGGGREGNRMQATLLRVVGSGKGMKVVDEEVFGPVLTIHVYDDFEDVLSMVNDTRYGLQAGLFTDSHARIRQAYDRLDVGALIVGDVPSFRVDNMPYGGMRDSGMGREGVRFAMEEMTARKLLVSRDA